MSNFFAQKVYAACVGGTTDIPLIGKIIDHIIQPIIGFLFALALVLFLWGITRFLLQANDDTAREQGKKHIIWGIFGMFIMVAVMGVIKLLADMFGFSGCLPSGI